MVLLTSCLRLLNLNAVLWMRKVCRDPGAVRNLLLHMYLVRLYSLLGPPATGFLELLTM
jgi:hypothetical protein